MTTTTIAQATPIKLYSGEWGARVTSTTVSAGDEIEISTRNGKRWRTVVRTIEWQGKGVTVVSTEGRE